jgi:hypothetical protein
MEVDLSPLKNAVPKQSHYISLPSSIGVKKHHTDAFTIYQCHIDANGELASMLEPGKTYMIKASSEDLGVKRWAYSDREQLTDNDGNQIQGYEVGRLVNGKSGIGNARFKVVKSLLWPPRVETKMVLCALSQSYNFAPNNSTILEVSVTNKGPDSVSVQARGHQRFLVPWGPFQPEPDANDYHTTVLDPRTHVSNSSSILVVDVASGTVVRESRQRRSVALTVSNPDRRPKVEDLVILKPGAPVITKIDLAVLMDGFKDGIYKIRLQPRGCRWWRGEIGKKEGEEGKVPAHLGGVNIPPLMIESQDEVEIFVRDGQGT